MEGKWKPNRKQINFCLDAHSTIKDIQENWIALSFVMDI